MLKFARFEAVRRNTQVNFLMQASGTGYLVGADSNGNNTLDPREKQELIAGFATLASIRRCADSDGHHRRPWAGPH